MFSTPIPIPWCYLIATYKDHFGQCCQRVDVMENGSSPCRKNWNSNWIWISTAKSWINLPDLHLRIIQTLLEHKKNSQSIKTFNSSMKLRSVFPWDSIGCENFVVQALPETRTKRSRWCSSATESSNEMASQFTLVKGQKSSNENDGRVQRSSIFFGLLLGL